VWCMFVGAVAPEVLFLLYVNLATTTLMYGTLGLGNRLEAPQGQADVGIVGLVGMWTPLGVFNAVRSGDPWNYGVALFDVHISVLVLVPLVQLGMAYLSFHVMERRLLNPLLPAYSKPLTYGILLLVDVIAAAVVYASPILQVSVRDRA